MTSAFRMSSYEIFAIEARQKIGNQLDLLTIRKRRISDVIREFILPPKAHEALLLAMDSMSETADGRCGFGLLKEMLGMDHSKRGLPAQFLQGSPKVLRLRPYFQP